MSRGQKKDPGVSLPRKARQGRAFRSNSSDLLMQILRDFRYNP
jgi:hypothetical protein